MTEEYLAARGRRGSQARFAAALAKVPKGEPEPDDHTFGNCRKAVSTHRAPADT